MDHITLGSLICSDVATDPWLKLISDMSIKSSYIIIRCFGCTYNSISRECVI